MNTAQIERLLTYIPNFQGVFSADKLPMNPYLFVANTDISTKAGEHWVGIFVNKNRQGEYFDSFGRPPNEEFTRYMNATCISWIYNTKQLQSVVSAFCGMYCVVFCKLKARNFDLRKIITMFSSDTGLNDLVVHRLICNK
jgi:hypothetical protein